MPAPSLPALRREIAACIAANEAARFPDDREGRAARFILTGLTDQLRKSLRALDRDIALPCGGPFGTVGRWQTREPGVRDWIRLSERERASAIETGRDASARRAATISNLSSSQKAA